MTVTGEIPSFLSSIAAASPAGPPPTTTGPSAIAIFASHQIGDLGGAEEPLAASHQGPCSTAEAVDVGRWNRARQGSVDLTAGDPFAEADDTAEVGVALDQLALVVGPRAELTDVRHPQGDRFGPCGEVESHLGECVAHPLRDRE